MMRGIYVYFTLYASAGAKAIGERQHTLLAANSGGKLYVVGDGDMVIH